MSAPRAPKPKSDPSSRKKVPGRLFFRTKIGSVSGMKDLEAIQSTRRRAVRLIKCDGVEQYRISGFRTGNPNKFDILDRSIPFTNWFSRHFTFHTDMMYWFFTCTFLKFFLASIVTFYLLNVIFTFLIFLTSANSPGCISSEFEEMKFWEKFVDAFHLSWTTFSTVGYGLISPVVVTDAFSGHHQCIGISILLSFESLIGVLSVGFSSAIIFGKLTRFQSNAQLTFSSILPVQFGEGYIDHDSEEDTVVTGDSSKDTSKGSRIPCPVLKFRIANELNSNRRGEIIDAELNVVATIDAKNSILGVRSEKVFNDALKLSITPVRRQSPNVHNDHSSRQDMAQERSPFTRNLRDALKRNDKTAHSQIEKLEAMYQIRKSSRYLDLGDEEEDQAGDSLKIEHNDLRSALQKTQSVYFQEETALDRPNLVFADVPVYPEVRPFFRCVWIVSHTLDESSPLLVKEVRKAVSENSGFWPEHLNNKESVSNSIHFDNLLVSFKGKSSLSGAEVHDQCVYKRSDLRVGVQFKSLLVQNLDGTIYIKLKDINETRIQKGGIPTRKHSTRWRPKILNKGKTVSFFVKNEDTIREDSSASRTKDNLTFDLGLPLSEGNKIYRGISSERLTSSGSQKNDRIDAKEANKGGVRSLGLPTISKDENDQSSLEQFEDNIIFDLGLPVQDRRNNSNLGIAEERPMSDGNK